MAELIGLTGQTGAGKSTVGKILRELGASVVDADAVSHEITDTDLDCLYEIVDRFSCVVLNEKGGLDRRRLGRIVFSDKTKLATLNKIMFPYIVKAIKTKTTALFEAGAKVVVVDGATLIESGFSKYCGTMISVTAAPEIREKRIIKRDGISKNDAARRIASQNGADFYAGASDYVIDNSGNEKALEVETETLYNHIIEGKRETASEEKIWAKQ